MFLFTSSGSFGCKLSIFTVATFYGTALLSLACVNIDRFYGICYSSLFDYEHRVRTMYIIPLVWIAAGMVYTPMLFACEKSHNPHDLTCDCSHSAWPKEKYHTIYEFLIVLATYVIPFSAMMYCHLKMYRELWNRSSAGVVLISTASIRSRKKVVKMLIAATLCFFIAWTPYNVLKILTELNLVGEKLLG